MEPRGRLKEWLLASALTLLAGAASAQIQPGREFQRIEPQRPVAAGGRIEVIEFFYYGCPVCYETQPFLSRWLGTAPEYVAIRRVPALSTEAWEPFAKLFYTLETLGQVGRLHWSVYDHFHFENVKLNDEKIMADWAARNGIERQKFVEVYGSPLRPWPRLPGGRRPPRTSAARCRCAAPNLPWFSRRWASPSRTA